MIQRIQTVWLLVSVVLLGLMFWLPLADITLSGELYLFNITGIHNAGQMIVGGLPLMIFLSLLIVLHLVTIFFFKKRILQVRILIFLMIALLALTGILFWYPNMGFKGAVVGFKPAVAFPFVAIVLDYLAVKAIGKDEALVRSLDRIR
jgi:hypothetical protein